MEKSNIFVGLDVHQRTIDVTIAEDGRGGEIRHYGVIDNTLEAIDGLIKKLDQPGRRFRFVYEAGPTGFVLYRHLRGREEDCAVVSPSMVPKRAGDRVKTDRRDSGSLARLHRAGELTAIYVPGPEDEAVRDLVRGREDAVHNQRRAKQRLKSFLLRHGRRYRGRANWSRAHRRWLSDQSFSHPAQQITFQEYIDSIEEAERRVERLTTQLREVVSSWRLAPVVEALQALRGVSFVTGATLVAEVGVFSRFASPTTLMAYFGLVPSEHSSGEKSRRGSITKAGNAHVRRALAEAAWAYRGRPGIGRQMLMRQEALPKDVRDIAWKAQLRLCGRYRRLAARRKSAPKIATAIARELVGFVWDIARRVEKTTVASAGR